jgi:hypothetical protein
MFFNQFPYTDFHELNADWIIRHFKEFVLWMKQIDGWIETHKKEYEELKKLYDDMYNGTLSPALERSLRIWINNNLESIIANAIKMVFFGLTDDGYFIAYIPDSWNDISFGTSGLDDFPPNVDFGHLTLSY